MNSIGDLKGKTVFFLQGPMGSFFARLDKQMRNQGAKTYKIALNAGDWVFANKDNVIVYQGKPEKWQKFISVFFKKYHVDYLFLFGDCRLYQKIAVNVAKELNIKVFVFEEGYVRPDYITCEKFGVNYFSQIPREKTFYEMLSEESCPPAQPMHNSYLRMALSATVYYLVANFFSFLFPYYKHHRGFSWIKELFYGIRSAFRKYLFASQQKQFNQRFRSDLSKKYYFAPLQVHSDFQIREHSSFKSMYEFIDVVISSFAHHAPKNTYLIFKHHPIDRGRVDYTQYIQTNAKLFGIHERVFSLHEIHLPTCLDHTIATITVNSTVGLSSLSHDIPTLALGKALYDIEGLTCKGMHLETFWTQYVKPDKLLLKKFRYFLIKNTQINSSFYGELGDLETTNQILA